MNEIDYQRASPPLPPRILRNKDLCDFCLAFLGKWSYSYGLAIWVGCCGLGMLIPFFE